MKLFGFKINISKEKSVSNDRKNHAVLCISGKATTYSERWGITEKRKVELDKISDKELRSCNTDVEAIENTSRSCVHSNELAYVTMYIIKENRTLHPMHHLLKLLSGDKD